MKVLVATKSLGVFDALQGVEAKKALYTDQVYQAIPEVQLAIIDWEDLIPYPHSIKMIKDLLVAKGILTISSQEFLAQPSRYLEPKPSPKGPRLPDKKCLAFVSYSGGTGKTTLALDTALHFARRTKLPVLLVEFTYGVSALAAITGLTMPSLYDLSTQLEAEAMRWKGVTLVPMDYESCQDLSAQLFGNYLKRQNADHILTVVDSSWPHGLLGAIREQIDEWLIVATPRIDAVENAKKLQSELASKNSKAIIILNNKGGLVDSLALTGLERALDLPQLRRPDRFEGQLGKEILSQAYGPGNWRKYEPSNLIADLRRRFGRGRHSA
jgi:hypothetical protein